VNLASSSEVYRTAGGTNRDYAVTSYDVGEADGNRGRGSLKSQLDGGLSRASAVTTLLRSTAGRARAPPTPSPSTSSARQPTESTYWSGQLAEAQRAHLYVKLASTSEFANG
jgi:hypothetical protein